MRLTNTTDPEICRIAQHIVDESMAPAASIFAATYRPDGWEYLQGVAGQTATVSNRPAPVSPNTPFDLASVTKSCVALTTALMACDSRIRLSEPIRQYLHELRNTPIGESTLEQLMSHRAGLPAHRVLFTDALAKRAYNRARLLKLVAASIGTHAPSLFNQDSSPHYSDLGYLLVGACLERIADSPLDAIVRSYISRPLRVSIGSSRQWRERYSNFAEQVAPSEFVPWRGGLIRGQVHDENAWAMSGFGTAGHAGLFGTAQDVALVGCAVIDSLVGRTSPIRRFAAHYCTAPRHGGTLRAGFDGKSGKDSAAGRLMGNSAFGHLGFTGTSLWCDPTLQISIVVLTNRVCPSRRNARLTAARRSIHERLTRYILGVNIDAST